MKSVEDHGFLLDLGFDDVHGFLSSTAMESYDHSTSSVNSLQPGAILSVSIAEPSVNGRMYNVAFTSVASETSASR